MDDSFDWSNYTTDSNTNSDGDSILRRVGADVKCNLENVAEPFHIKSIPVLNNGINFSSITRALEKLNSEVENYLNLYTEFIKFYSESQNKTFSMKKKIIFDKDASCYYPKPGSEGIVSYYTSYAKIENVEKIEFEGLEFTLPDDENFCRNLFNRKTFDAYNYNQSRTRAFLVKYDSPSMIKEKTIRIFEVDNQGFTRKVSDVEAYLCLPVIRCNFKNWPEILNDWLDKYLIPEDLGENFLKIYSFYPYFKKFIDIDDVHGNFSVQVGDIVKDFLENINNNEFVNKTIDAEEFSNLLQSYNSIKEYTDVKDGKLVLNTETDNFKAYSNRVNKSPVFGYEYASSDINQEPINRIRSAILKSDKYRAKLNEYDAAQLTNPEGGNWDLYEALADISREKRKPEDISYLPLNEAWTVRPPVCDIAKQAICGIDFGSSSTVIALRPPSGKKVSTHLLCVGSNKDDQADEYKNPTLIEFKKYANFFTAYSEREGRPFTCINDLPVSHLALNNLKQNLGQGNISYAIFNNLKLWCQNCRTVRYFRDNLGKGESIRIEQYENLKEGDFDPIEIYAYYLGLYVNNMQPGNGIVLKYVLSYPINFSSEIKEKIKKSFERGLKKSLPPSILRNEEVMKDFTVCLGASEPTSFAITALSRDSYSVFSDARKDKVAYAVFDFGGGTTDFDYGLAAKCNRREDGCNLWLKSLDSGGDPDLGGEHIVDLIGYEIYKNNIDDIRKSGKHIWIKHPAGAVYDYTMRNYVYQADQCKDVCYLNSYQLAAKFKDYWLNDFKSIGKARGNNEAPSSSGADNGVQATDKSNDGHPRDDLGKTDKQAVSSADSSNEAPSSGGADNEVQETNKSNDDHPRDDLDKTEEQAVRNAGSNNEAPSSSGASDDSATVELYYYEDLNSEAAAMNLGTHPIEFKNINMTALRNKVKERIKRGVDNFFGKLKNVFFNQDKGNFEQYYPIHIFLAGDSCKSPIVKELFDEKMEEFAQSVGVDHDKIFKLMPLPAPKDKEHSGDGKTSVAFGVLRTHESLLDVNIEPNDNEANNYFKYRLGYCDNDDFIDINYSNGWERYARSYPTGGIMLYYTANYREGLKSCDVSSVSLQVSEKFEGRRELWICSSGQKVLKFMLNEPGQDRDEVKNKIYEIDLSTGQYLT